MRHIGYKLWPWEGFRRHVSSVETARTCLKCGQCEEACPYQLPIRDMLVEGVAFYERVAAEHGESRR